MTKTLLTTDPPILVRLKQETAAAHARVDALMNLDDLDRVRYRSVLVTFRAVYSIIERELARHAGALDAFGYDCDARSRLAWLDADITDLAVPVPVMPRAPTPLPAFTLGTIDAAVGAVYVTEGATLGGRYVARHVIPSLSLDAPAGCRFFLGYGDLTGARWKQTTAAIAAFAARPAASPDAIVRGAHDTFALFEDALRSMA